MAVARSLCRIKYCHAAVVLLDVICPNLIFILPICMDIESSFLLELQPWCLEGGPITQQLTGIVH